MSERQHSSSIPSWTSLEIPVDRYWSLTNTQRGPDWSRQRQRLAMHTTPSYLEKVREPPLPNSVATKRGCGTEHTATRVELPPQVQAASETPSPSAITRLLVDLLRTSFFLGRVIIGYTGRVIRFVRRSGHATTVRNQSR